MARSVWFPEARRVELREEPVPDPQPGEVRVRAVASAISQGTEMLVYRGQVEPAMALDLPTLRGRFGFPIKYGYASVGQVVESRSESAELEIGRYVFVHHPHQSEYVVPATYAVPLPEGIDPVVGVFLANLETAVNVLLDAAPRLGERIVVFGQGVVGLLLTQLLRRTGAGLVLTVDAFERRRGLSRRLGADVVLSPDENVAATVREWTEGVGADLVIEASGSPRALDQAIDCAAFQGTIVVCSWYGTKPVTLDLGGAFHRGRLRLVSSQVSNLDPALQPRWSIPRRRALARRLLVELELAPLITHRVPVERAREAYELINRYPEQTVQVILTYGGGDV